MPRPVPAGRWVSGLLPGIADDTHPRDLSEGQCLALALAVVLTARPPLLLLDEPTRGLDYAAKARLVDVLRELAAEGHAIVLATHDVELAAELAHRVVLLAEGEVIADGPTADIVVSSPSFAPQVTKILAPQRWLTVAEVRRPSREAAPGCTPSVSAPRSLRRAGADQCRRRGRPVLAVPGPARLAGGARMRRTRRGSSRVCWSCWWRWWPRRSRSRPWAEGGGDAGRAGRDGGGATADRRGYGGDRADVLP